MNPKLAGMIGVALFLTCLVAYQIAHPSETHAQTLARHGVAVSDPTANAKALLFKEETRRAALQTAAKGGEALAKPAFKAARKDAGKHVEEEQEEVKEEEATQTWRGMDVPLSGTWDFKGLPVDMDTPAKDKIRPESVRADYQWDDVHRKPAPKEYAYGPDPGFEYPGDLDPLFVTVSHTPRILYFPKIATDAEMEEVIRQAEPHMERSRLSLDKNDLAAKRQEVQEIRSSKGYFLTLQGSLTPLQDRMNAVVGHSDHEPMNVLFYGPKQHYEAHHDCMAPVCLRWARMETIRSGHRRTGPGWARERESWAQGIPTPLLNAFWGLNWL